jgi:molybdate/tungstate transport system substrate-binding protein
MVVSRENAGLRSALQVLCLLCGLLIACKSKTTDVTVFYASSLTAVLGDAAEAFQKANPQVRVRLEPSGSQVAVRKVSELGMRADIVAVADAGLIPRMMVPSHATWNALFATNEIVIAHKDHSKWTDQITSQNWAEILTRDGVRLGRADPDTAPIGYQTLMVWQLAEAAGMKGHGSAGLAAQLLARCAKEHVTHDEAELLALLESRAIDYAFIFRSTAEDHHLKVLSLPPEVNLSRQELADRYAAVHVDIRMRRGQGSSTVTGAPIVYGLTIPSNAPHADVATRFVSFLLGDVGAKLLLRRGFHPISPATCNPCAGLPEQLASASKNPAPSLP